VSLRPLLGWSSGNPLNRVPVTYPDQDNLITIAPPGAGKSRCVAIPNMVRYQGSTVSFDGGKGDVGSATALWRWAALGQQVTVFDPLLGIDPRLIPPGPDGLPNYGFADPLDFIRGDRNPMTAAFKVADALIPMESLRETHWAEAAQARLVATMLFVGFDSWFQHFEDQDGKPLPRTFASVWTLLSDPR
jgi:type IV secretion system protein VirD4